MNKELANALRYLFLTIEYCNLTTMLVDWCKNANTETLKTVTDTTNPFGPYIALREEYQNFILEELFERED